MKRTFLALLLACPAGSARAADGLTEGFRQAAEAAAARGACHKLSRVALWKPAGAPEAAYKPWGQWVSYLSRENAPFVLGMITPWSNRVRSFRLWVAELEIKPEGLACALSFETQEFPLDGEEHTVWTRAHLFKTGVPFVYENTAADPADPRDFRVTFVWTPEPDASRCALP